MQKLLDTVAELLDAIARRGDEGGRVAALSAAEHLKMARALMVKPAAAVKPKAKKRGAK